MNNKTKKWSVLSLIAMVCLSCGFAVAGFNTPLTTTQGTTQIVAKAADGDDVSTNVAKVGNTEYATIDEAIAAWSNGSTLTLLSDVQLTKVIELSSTEHHILDLGTYTMTAASKTDAIQIVNNGRSSASYALDIKADATNPGGITASGKAVVRTTGKSGVQDRPIIRFYNGVFTGSYVVYHSGSNGTNCPQFQFHGGVFNGTIYTNRSLNQFFGGTFTGSLQMSVDSSAYTLIAGGTFAKLSNMMGSSLNSGKFTIGSAKGVYDKEVYIDDNGNYVIAAAEPTEGIEAAVKKTPGTNDYLAYSKVATEGALNYTDAVTAIKNNTSATITVYADELDLEGINFKGTIVVPEGQTLKITNAPEGLKTEGAVTIVKPVAKIGSVSYETLADAINAAQAGDTITVVEAFSDVAVTVDKNLTITGAVTLNNVSISGSTDIELTVSGLTFTGNSWIDIKGAKKLTVSGVTANVTPSNTAATNSRSAFISLGRSESVTLDLTVENCNIVSKGGSDPILGWAAVKNVKLTGNTFGSESAHQNNSDSVKFMSIADGAKFEITGNTVYSDYNGIVFAQNTTRDNAYSVYLDKNTFVGAADHIWIEVSGSKTVHIALNATSDNTVNGKAFTTEDIKHYYLTTWTAYAGVDLEFDENGKVAGGQLAYYSSEVIADGYEVSEDGRVVKESFAKVNDVAYATLEEAVANAQAGDTITLIKDVTLSADLTLPAGITFNGNGKQVNGNLVAGGNLTFVGYNKIANFNAGYNKPTITIGVGATLETTSGRMVIGHGATFNITGSIVYAKTANVADLTPSLIMPGASFTGAGVNFNVTNAYIKATAYCSSKNSNANNTFNFNITNSIWEQTGSFVFTEPTSGKDPTFNLTLTNSVLNSTSHLVFAVTKGEIVFDNSNVNVGTSRQLENRSTLTIKNGSVVNGAVATSSNAKNPGTVIVENATYAVTGEFSGSDLGTGTLVVKIGATVSIGSITKANIVIDAENFNAGDEVNVTANLSKLAGTLTVINNDKLEAKIQDGKIVLEQKPVAEVNGDGYATLEAAIEAAQAGATIKLLDDVDANAVIFIDKSLTIEGNNYKISSSANRVIRITVGNVEVTINNLNMVSNAVRVGTNDIRGISIDAGLSNVALTLNNCSVDFTDASANDWTYAVNVSGNGTGHAVTVNGGSYEGANVINVNGANNTITVKDATLTCLYPDNDMYEGACIWVLQNQGSSVEATGNTFHGSNAVALNLGTGTNLTESNNTDNTVVVIAKIGATYYTSLADAFAEGGEITLLRNVEISEPLTVPAGKTVVLDLNGHTITGTDNTTKNFGLINNSGTLTITGNGTITLIATEPSGWSRYSSVVSNQVGGKLVVNGGTIEHLGGTDMAYAIDNLTNGKGTYAETVINGGTIKSTYRAIRQFLNGVEAENILTINGGTVEGTNKSVWFQDPSANANSGKLTIGADATINGDVYLFVTAGSTEWPVEVSIASAALKNDSAVVTGNVPASYVVEESNGVYGVVEVVAKIGDAGYETLEEAFAAAQSGETITLVSDLTFESTLADAGKGMFNVADGKKITLDLNGKKISVTDNSAGNFIVFYNYGEFTIKNGTVELTATIDRDWNAQSTIILNRGGVLNVESGTYTHNGGTDMAITLDNSANSFGDATMNIQAGDISSTYIAIRNRMEQNNSGHGKAILNVNGGKIDGTSRAIWAQASSPSTTAPATGAINVTGGEVGLIDTARSSGAISMTTISGGNVAAFKGEVGELTVNGGSLAEVTILTTAGEAADYAITADGLYAEAVAKVGEVSYASLQEAIYAANNATVVVLADIDLGSTTVKIPASTKVTLDLNGKTISGECNANQASMFVVENTATFIVKDTATNGKITYAAGTSNVGFEIDVKGAFVLESGIIELTGSWSLGFAVDVRPNSWGSEYTAGSSFVMNGGKISSSDTAVRVASSSATGHENVSASFTMNGGVIESGWDAIFIQHGSDAPFNVELNDGTVSGDNTVIRIYGSDTNDINLAVKGGTYTGKLVNLSATGNGKTAIQGGTFSTAVEAEWCAEGFEPVENADGTFGVAKEVPVSVNLTIGKDLSVNFYIDKDIVDSNATVSMIFSIADRNDETVAAVLDEAKGLLKFTFKGVGPQKMGKTITAQLVVDGEVIKTIEYSIETYCYAQLKLTQEQLGYTNEQYAAYRSFLVNLLNYGAASQVYANYDAENLVTDNLTAEELAYANTYHAVKPIENPSLTPAGVRVGKTVLFGSTNKIRFIMMATDASINLAEWKVEVYGNHHMGTVMDLKWDAAEGYYYIEVEDILATEYNIQYIFMIVNATGAKVGMNSYSIQHYVNKYQDSTSDVKLANLVKAVWNYGHAANDYIDLFY